MYLTTIPMATKKRIPVYKPLIKGKSIKPISNSRNQGLKEIKFAISSIKKGVFEF